MTQVVIKRPTWAEIFQAEVELTDAQIKALPTTGIQLVAAPGAGKMLLPIGVVLSTSLVAAYTGADVVDDYLVVRYIHASGAECVQVSNSATDTTLEDLLTAVGASVLRPVFPPALNDASWGIIGIPNVVPSAQITNLGLEIAAVVAGGNLTGGNAANTLKVIIIYAIIDV